MPSAAHLRASDSETGLLTAKFLDTGLLARDPCLCSQKKTEKAKPVMHKSFFNSTVTFMQRYQHQSVLSKQTTNA